MTRKRAEKKISFLQSQFEEVLVCKDKKYRPYLEIFVAEPENVFQQNLGTLFGILEITDDSEESSYVVNFLISTIKKEYYSQTKRGPIESFEAALHRANLALAKLAEHGQIGWIGHFNAICAVIEKNNIHLAQAGTASAYLLRSKLLVSIGEAESDVAEPNPLKTFEEVVSGRMEKDDKVILTTEGIFEIFSLEEIKRSAIKFSDKQFVQFLHTALINELDRAGVLIINMAEKEEVQTMQSSSKSSDINVFSQEAFSKKSDTYEEREKVKQQAVSELKEELGEYQKDFVDAKTGHIYIKDEGYIDDEKGVVSQTIKDSLENFSAGAGNLSGLLMKKAKSNLINIKGRLFSKEDIENPDIETTLPENKIIKEPFPWKEKITALGKNTGLFFHKIASIIRIIFFYVRSFAKNRIFIPAIGLVRSLYGNIRTKISSGKKKYVERKTERKIDYASNPEIAISTREEKKEWFNALSKKTEDIYSPRPAGRTKSFLPDFGKIRQLFASMDYSRKLYIITIIILLFVVPYFIVKIQDQWQKKEMPPLAQAENYYAPPLEQDKNVIRIENLSDIYQGSAIKKIVNINDKIFVIEEGKIVSLDDNKSYDIPQEFARFDLATEMDDLNLIFLLKDKRILSFAANNGKFTDNKISVPDSTKIVDIGSYLTYVYVADSGTNQIYRYPRAEGGFGDKTNWAKDILDLSNIKEMAISGDVYLTDGKNIIKYNKGKHQEYAMENSATTINVNKLYAKPDSENLYVLDKTNGRIIKLNKDGGIIAQYYNTGINNATDFAVSEKNNTVFITTGEKVESFSIQ